MINHEHAMVVVIENDDLDTFMICNNRVEGVCQDPSAQQLAEQSHYLSKNQCALQEHLFGMSDFGAYRSGGESVTLLDFSVSSDGVNSVREDENGTSYLELVSTNEYLEIKLDGKWVGDIGFTGAKMLYAPIAWHADSYHEHYWSFADDFQYFRPNDAEWEELRNRRWSA